MTDFDGWNRCRLLKWGLHILNTDRLQAEQQPNTENAVNNKIVIFGARNEYHVSPRHRYHLQRYNQIHQS